MADPTISHGWVTAEPDAGKDVDADNLNDHQITGFGAAVTAIVSPAVATEATARAAADTAAIATAAADATSKVAAEATLARNADNLASGTVADARIASTIARDSEVTSAVAGEATARDSAITSAIGALSSTYQPLDSDLTAIAALTTTAYGRALLALADAAAGRTALGLGTASTHATGDYDAAGAAAAAQSASQPLDSDLTAIAALTTTAFGRGLLALADAAALRTAAGLGTAALAATGDFDAAGAAAAAQAASQPLDSDLTAIAALATTSYGRSLLALADAAALRTAAASVIGTDVEAHDADLTTIAGLSPTNDDLLQRKAGAWANRTIAQLLTDLAAAGTTFQPLDSDLTSIAALTTTSFGRGLLALADAAALAANHSHSGSGSLVTGNILLPWIVEPLSTLPDIAGLTITASENFGSALPWNAAYSYSNGWLTNGSALPQWWKVQLPLALICNAYALVPWFADNYPGRALKTWTFEGSNDNSSWTTLDTQTNYTAWASATTPTRFPFTNTTAYLYYRVNISAVQTGPYTGIGRIWLWGPIRVTQT